jgi:hypothetical protein
MANKQRAATFQSEKHHQRHLERQARLTEAKVKAQSSFNEKVLKVSRDGPMPVIEQEGKDLREAKSKGAISALKGIQLLEVIDGIIKDFTVEKRWSPFSAVYKSVGQMMVDGETLVVDTGGPPDENGKFNSFSVNSPSRPQLKEAQGKNSTDVGALLAKQSEGNAFHRENPPTEFRIERQGEAVDHCTASNPDGRSDVVRGESSHRAIERELMRRHGNRAEEPETDSGTLKTGANQ